MDINWIVLYVSKYLLELEKQIIAIDIRLEK